MLEQIAAPISSVDEQKQTFPQLGRFFVGFLLEEVTFPGAIDSYVCQAGDKYPWVAAFFVSMLWGLWEVPTVSNHSLAQTLALILFHSILGIPLSFAWRKCGNLAVPCAVHAIVDAVRNGLGLYSF